MGYISVPKENLEKLLGLSGKTIYVYLLLRSLLFYKKGMNKGNLVPVEDEFKLSYGDAKELGINKNTFERAMKALLKVGLVEREKKGKWKGRRPNVYRIV